ncbi:hypothetical protein PF005_g11385 [Phytophthora fragariae]|uniref:Uncharacterized protein n=1 Tax=Phytophthora fragariae TaxID=53985 RepID=A0A6A3S8Y7_9STRA|nr:hypothetical protein PF003_g254 [Phytophthora fragariae]KAE8938857.1 hypothetical protein PF009_g11278 [Phytophthora fragariae]KAE9111720.1 hypothetical protein PF007_g11374 [Phytophthora fragariae]KAE9111800.1 hypothetical protein PF010_g10677 [Phytophthora fragariae]KAE9144028.1 hypothetical protein PF006_g10990 [Phytophthora fragariae]
MRVKLVTTATSFLSANPTECACSAARPRSLFGRISTPQLPPPRREPGTGERRGAMSRPPTRPESRSLASATSRALRSLGCTGDVSIALFSSFLS